MTKWVHYSDSNATILLKSKEQSSFDYIKPNGLWITPENVEANWKDWCENEEFRLEQLRYIHDVSFHAQANLCKIETPENSWWPSMKNMRLRLLVFLVSFGSIGFVSPRNSMAF